MSHAGRRLSFCRGSVSTNRRSEWCDRNGFLWFMMSVALLSGCLSWPWEDQRKPELITSNVVTLTATVEGIDYATRTATLREPQGNRVTLKVSDEVQNLAQVKAGDQVVAEYVESVAVFVRKPELGATTSDMSVVDVSARGEKPKKVTVEIQEIRAIVESIDYSNRLMTIRGPRGNTLTIPVHESVKNFENVKQGDEIVARHTETVMINVRKP